MVAHSIRFAGLAITLSLCSMQALSAQDTRHVTEPVIPPSCVVLQANLHATDNALAESDETKLDTQ